MAAKTIVLFSTKGGVGKSLLAVNLAFSLHKQKKRVFLVDADLDVVGDMGRMMGLAPNKSLADIMYLMKKGKDVEPAEFIEKYFDGFDFVPGVLRQQQISHFSPGLVKHVFALYQNNYDYIIVDGGKAFSESLVRFFDEANLLLLLVTPDVLSVYQTKWALDTLQSLKFPLKMVKLLLNRAESVASISWQEMKLAFPCEIITRIPSEGKVAMLSINKRIPLSKEYPHSKIAGALKGLADDIIKGADLFLEHKELESFKVETQQKEALWEKTGLVEVLERPELEEKEKDEIVLLKQRVHEKLINSLDLKRIHMDAFSQKAKMKALRDKAERQVSDFLAGETHSLLGSLETRKKICREIIDEALGLGPLEDLLKDPEITDIMVNNKEEVYVERKGKIELTSKRFIANDQVKTIIDRIIAPIGRHIDESIPMVDARLPDGSRVNAIIPPLALTGPTLTIRKFRKERFTVEELVGMNSLNHAMGKFLEACVISCKNMIVSGGTGSGKTTVLNILSSFISENERIITIEDAAELKLNQRHWLRLESRPPNIEGKGAIGIRDLFRNTLRMRPDRIIVGECRSYETLDMLQAMNTGHDGSMTTLHANSTRDVLVRLDSMILMSGVELPIRAIREMIASAIDMIVHTARLSDGSRKVTKITELVGMTDDTHIELKDVFSFKQKGLDQHGNVVGDFCPTGYIPTFFEDMKARGIDISEDIFRK